MGECCSVSPPDDSPGQGILFQFAGCEDRLAVDDDMLDAARE